MAILTGRDPLVSVATDDIIHVVDVSDTTDDATGSSRSVEVANLPISTATTNALAGKQNNWTSLGVSSSTSPLAPLTTYLVDATSGDITMSLPDLTSGNDKQIYRILMASNTNNVIITTVSGTDNVGALTSQAIASVDSGITVQADFATTTYNIIQDSRPKAQESSITLYALTEASGVSTYSRAATSTTDSDYSGTPTDVASGSFSGDDNLIYSFITNAGVVQGLVNESVMSASANLKATAGKGFVYIEVYKRVSGGTETLLGTSSVTAKIDSGTYQEFNVSAIISSETFLSTDRLLIKVYGNQDGGAAVNLDMQVEGGTPARATLTLPTGSIAHDSLSGVNAAGAGISNGHIDATTQTIAGLKTFTDGVVVLGNQVTDATTTRTLALTDAGKYIRFTSGSATTCTVPPNSGVALVIGTEIEFIQAGAGTVTFAEGSGVTINSIDSNLALSGQYAGAALKKVATDEWDLVGSLA